MSRRPRIAAALKVFILLMIATWGVVGSYRVITSEIMNYTIFNQNISAGGGSALLLESENAEQHDGEISVGRGRGGVGRGGGGGGGRAGSGNGGGGKQFLAEPDAFNRYLNYAGMFALIVLIVYWIQKYADFRKKAKK